MGLAISEIQKLFKDNFIRIVEDDPVVLTEILDSSNEFIKSLNEPFSSQCSSMLKTITTTLHNTCDNVGTFKTSLDILNDLIDLVSQISSKPGCIKLFNQDWYIERMKAVGYKLDDGGHCFGMSNMSLQAFMADDIQAFNSRLELISDIPVEDFQNDCLNLRKKRAELISQAKMYDEDVKPDEAKNKRDEAEEINQNITDILAFFDGIALHQSPKNYQDWFEPSAKIDGQDVKLTGPLTLSAKLDSESTKPVLINIHTGSYTKEELTDYINTLTKHLGKTSFSLKLASAQHAINLNYDATKRRWVLIDPNFLPGKDYIHAELLADALIFEFQNKKGLVMETSLYSRNNDAQTLTDNFLLMEKSLEWQELHSAEKLNTTYEDGAPQIQYALNRNDTAWLRKTIPLGLDLNKVNQRVGITPLMAAIASQKAELVDILLSSGADVNFRDSKERTALDFAWLTQNKDYITSLIQHGAQPKEFMLDAACETGDVDMVCSILRAGMPTTHAVGRMLTSACCNNNLDVVDKLLKEGIKIRPMQLYFALKNKSFDVAIRIITNSEKLNAQLISIAYSSGNDAVVSALKNRTDILTKEMLAEAENYVQIGAIQFLIENGVEPTASSVLSLCYESDITEIKLDARVIDELVQGTTVYMSVEEDIKKLLDKQIINPDDLFLSACKQGKVDVVNILLANKIKVSEDMVLKACQVNNPEIIHVLFDNGIKPSDDTFLKIATEGNLDLINSSIDQEVITPDEMLKHAVEVGDLKVVTKLIENGVEPTQEVLFKSFCNKNNEITKVLVEKLLPKTFDNFEINTKLEEDLHLTKDEVEIVLQEVKSNIMLTIKDPACILGNKKMSSVILDQIDKLASDKKSTLGKIVQNRKNPIFDKIIGQMSGNPDRIIPDKMKKYKKILNQLRENDSIEDTKPNRPKF